LDPKTILTYRTGVDQFVENCAKTYVEDVTKQDMINFMGWLRKQPLPKRRNSNPIAPTPTRLAQNYMQTSFVRSGAGTERESELSHCKIRCSSDCNTRFCEVSKKGALSLSS
jgi:hypothetical protein